MHDKSCHSLDNIHECASADVSISNKLLIIISLHKQLNGDIKTIDVINKMFMNKQLTIFMRSHFNINQLNSHKNKGSIKFAGSSLTLGLFPCINRPPQITSHWATLINNIFTKINNSQLKCGLLINDTTDDFHIFITINVRQQEINK